MDDDDPAGVLRGERRYDHFRSKLGLGSNVLNDRLRVLVDEGVLERVRYQDHPARYEYRLTKKGARSLSGAAVPGCLGNKYKNDVPPMRLIHRGCGHAAEPRMTCAHCGEPLLLA